MRRRIHLVKLEDIMTTGEIATLEKGLKQMSWNSGIPGGFVTNTPQRLVNSYGDGSGYNNNLKSVGEKWEYAFWTPAVHQSDSTLVTSVEPLPDHLKMLGLKARKVAHDKYDIFLDDHSFNLAVCNFYTTSTDEIAAHTDDNGWYARDLPEGPMFASLTMYPDRKPHLAHEFARFELFIDGKWCHYQLPHASLLLMPSCIPHRVRPCKRDSDMFTRINITLRSVPDVKQDAFNSLRGMSNHARYYRLPERLIVAMDKKIEGHILSIQFAFDKCLKNHGKAKLDIVRSTTSDIRKKRRKLMVDTLKRSGSITSAIRANVVNELLEAVLEYTVNN